MSRKPIHQSVIDKAREATATMRADLAAAHDGAHEHLSSTTLAVADTDSTTGTTATDEPSG